MIIRLKEQEGLSHLAKKLRALPEEQRKVIILVGRHRNEGTHLIARKHHTEWAEHGAVVIQIPRKWTPETFWSRLLRGKHPLSKAYTKFISGSKYDYTSKVKLENKIKKTFKSDNEIMEHLTKAGFHVPFINFHGTVARHVPFENYYYVNPSTNLPWIDGVNPDNDNHPNELLFENHFIGLYNRRNKHVTDRNKELDIGQLGVSYLRKDRLPLPAIKSFTTQDHADFLSILKELAEKGLKK